MVSGYYSPFMILKHLTFECNNTHKNRLWWSQKGVLSHIKSFESKEKLHAHCSLFKVVNYLCSQQWFYFPLTNMVVSYFTSLKLRPKSEIFQNPRSIWNLWFILRLNSPKTVRAGTDSRLSQKDTWDSMTVMMHGRYVWITK